MKNLFKFTIGWIILCALLSLAGIVLVGWLIITLIHYFGG